MDLQKEYTQLKIQTREIEKSINAGNVRIGIHKMNRQLTLNRMRMSSLHNKIKGGNYV